MSDNKEKIEKLKKGLSNPNISDAHKELMRKKIAELELGSKAKEPSSDTLDIVNHLMSLDLESFADSTSYIMSDDYDKVLYRAEDDVWKKSYSENVAKKILSSGVNKKSYLSTIGFNKVNSKKDPVGNAFNEKLGIKPDPSKKNIYTPPKKSEKEKDIDNFLKANPKKTKKEAEQYFDNLEAKKMFELGTPVTFKHNGEKVSGEVVSKNGKKVVSLYKDSNYSGNSERIVEPNWIEVSSFNKANSESKTNAKSKPKKRTNNKVKELHKLAKEIRKEGESYRDALKRASKVLKGETKKPIKRKKNKPKQTGTSKKSIDSKRKALPVGKRVSKNGKVYYEYRANRSDIDPKKKL